MTSPNQMVVGKGKPNSLIGEGLLKGPVPANPPKSLTNSLQWNDRTTKGCIYFPSEMTADRTCHVNITPLILRLQYIPSGSNSTCYSHQQNDRSNKIVQITKPISVMLNITPLRVSKSNLCQVNITPLTIQFAQIANPISVKLISHLWQWFSRFSQMKTRSLVNTTPLRLLS